MKRFLGIDYGTKRIGLALSDENGVLAFPEEIILNDKKTIEKIGVLIRKRKIKEIVIGESVNFSGQLNVLASKIEVFISTLKKNFNLLVHKQKEFLTSVEARRPKEGKKSFSKTQAHSKIKKKKSERADAGAAALILQRYLDKINKQDNQLR